MATAATTISPTIPPLTARWAVPLTLLVGACLRLYGLRRAVFVNPDEGLWSYFIVNTAQLPWLSRDLAHSALARILSWDYGWPMFLFWDLYVRLLTALGISINEFTLRLPQVALGLLLCWLVWRLGQRLIGTPAALLALLLMVIMPYMVAWSRTLGGSTMSNSVLLLVAALGVLRYLDAPEDRRTQWLAGLTVGLYLCGDVQFVIGGAVLVALLLLGPRPEAYAGWSGAWRLLWRPGILVPIVVLFAPYVAAYAYAIHLGYPDQTYLGTVLGEHKAVWGLHVGPFLRDLWHNTGLYFLLALLVVPATLGRVRGTERAWLLTWAALTAAPFLLAVTGAVTQAHCYQNHLLIALTLLLAYGLTHLQRRATLVLAVLVITLGTTLTTVAAVYNVAPLRAILWPFAEAPFGGLAPNHGLKAAGYWVRTHLPPDQRVFVAHDPCLAFWYLGREAVLGGYYADQERAPSFLRVRDQVQAALITRGTARYPESLFTASGFPGRVSIQEAGEEIARLHTRRPGRETLEVGEAERLFNRAYRRPEQIIPPGSPYVPGKRAPGQ